MGTGRAARDDGGVELMAATAERGREAEMGHGAFEHGLASSFLVFFFPSFPHLFLIFSSSLDLQVPWFRVFRIGFWFCEVMRP
jgi:hypothetical protein